MGKGGSIIRENPMSSNLWGSKKARRPLKIYERGLLCFSDPSPFSVLILFPKCLTVCYFYGTETWAPKK